MFPQFDFFGRTIGMYGLCAVIGLLICGFVCCIAAQKRGAEIEDIIIAIVCAGIGIMVGGHLLFGIVSLPKLPEYIQNIDSFTVGSFFSLLGTLFGGSVFYGGFFGSLLAVSIYGKIKKDRALYLDILAFATPLFHVFGRIGCFLAGCCHGIECEFGFTAHGNTLVPSVNGVSRFPVQLLEALLNLMLFSVIIILFRKERFKGKLIFIYMASYAVIRFCTEFLRGDEIRGFFLCFSTSQWISLVLFPCALVAFVLSFRKGNRNIQ